MSHKRKKKVPPATIDDPRDNDPWGRYPNQIPNPDANKTEFDLRSNIGQQFGSQGTLFQVSKRPRSTVGPKGFSPERQDLVRAKTHVSADDLATLPQGGWLGTDYDDRGMLTPKANGRRRVAERRVQDIVSRSSAPIEDRVGVRVVHPDDKDLISVGAPYGWAAAGGVYKTFANGPHAIASLDSVFPGVPGEGRKKNRLYSDNLIHELGHHHSAMTNPDKDYTTPEGQGREEAFADDFSATHRPRRYRNIPNHEIPYPDLGRHAGFREAYDNARTTPTLYAQVFVNPNVPGSAHSVVAHGKGDQDRFIENNPTLPGMEYAQDFTDRYVLPDHGRLQGYESLPNHETRVLNRQTEAIRKRVEGQ